MGLASECPVLGADQVQNGASPDEVQGARVVLCDFRLFFPKRKETQSWNVMNIFFNYQLESIHCYNYSQTVFC